MLALVLLALGGSAAALPKYVPLEMHELIGLADVCVAGTIVTVFEHKVIVQIESVGFGEPVGEEIHVQRFRDWTCASRWKPYAVGQRCLYFLAGTQERGYQILSGGGEGEMALDEHDGVRMRVSLGGRDTLGRRPPLEALLAECRRYRSVFRFCPTQRSYWIEPLVSEEEVELYGSSSPMAGFLCLNTRQGQYRSFARSPRPPDAIPRIDLGMGMGQSAVVGVPDRDDDGIDELLCAQYDQLWLLQPTERGEVKKRERLGHPSDSLPCSALAYLGDLDGDGRPEVAVGDSESWSGEHRWGAIEVLALGAEGDLDRRSRLQLSDSVFGSKAFRPEGFGQALASLGDLDGDGTQTLAVSASVGWGPAQVWIVILDADGSALRATCVFGDEFVSPGMLSLANLGDLDGNGVTDLAVGMPNASSGSMSGVVRVFLLEKTGKTRREITLPSDERRGSGFGRSVAGIGDWNGDGIPDLAVSSKTVRVLYLDREGCARDELELAVPSVGPAWHTPRLCAWPSGGAAPRLLVSGLSWVDEAAKVAYLSVWAFDAPSGAAQRPR